MRTYQETINYLSSLTNRRIDRYELQYEMQQFFGTTNQFIDEEEYDDPDMDWTLYFSTGSMWEDEQIDMQITYSLTRTGDIVILYVELMGYQC